MPAWRIAVVKSRMPRVLVTLLVAFAMLAMAPPQANVGEEGLEQALQRAANESKQVLVPFGANW